MKQSVKTSRSAGYLEKIFRALNSRYFEGQLEEPIITIQSTPRAYGHVTVAKAWSRGDSARHDLNLGAGTLNRPIEETVATMLHEMVHLYCLQNDIKDTSRGGAYHNKRFRAEAIARDLDIRYDQRIGWSITNPTPALCDYIIAQGWLDIQMNRMEWSCTPRGAGSGSAAGGASAPPPNKSGVRKYQCPCCGSSVRATKTVRILCMDCSKPMLLVS